MKQLYLVFVSLFIHFLAYAQQNVVAKNAQVFKGKLLRVSDPFHPDPKVTAKVVRNEGGVIGKEELMDLKPSAPYPLLQQKSDGALF